MFCWMDVGLIGVAGDIMMLSKGRRDVDNVFALKDGVWFSASSLLLKLTDTFSRETDTIPRQGDIRTSRSRGQALWG